MPDAAVAVRVQVPVVTLVTVKLETVHTLVVELETTTGKPAELVGLTVKVAGELIRVPGEVKVIVCKACVISHEVVASPARYNTGPTVTAAAVTLTVHVPAATAVRVVPETVHTEGVWVVKVLVPDAVATRVGLAPTKTFTKAGNVTVWAPAGSRM